MKAVFNGRGYLNIGNAFRKIAKEAKLKKNQTVIFSGCPGACYSYATSYSGELRAFEPVAYFVSNSDTEQAWRLDPVENLGVSATQKEKPGKAKLIFVMCGLTCDITKDGKFVHSSEEVLRNTKRMIEEHLTVDGKVILESAFGTDMPNIFSKMKWKKQIDADYTLEYCVDRVKAQRNK